MKSIMWFIIFLATVLSYCEQSNATTDEEAKAIFTKQVLNCTTKHPIEMKELINLQRLKIPTDKKTMCLLACAYRLEGCFNNKGMYDVDCVYKRVEYLSNGDKKRLENGKKVADICTKVNDVQVSDGEEGCERAGLMFKCLVTEAPKYGFKV